jgi:hypothetical protein
MRRPQLSYANVVSTLALALAVGTGTSWATTSRHAEAPAAHPAKASGTHLARNTVGTAQLRAGAVHKVDIAPSTINSLRGAKGDPGSQGPAGPAGAPGISYFAVVSGAGELLRGNAAAGNHTTNSSGSYTITFPKNVSACAYSVALGGIDATSQPPGYATVRDDGGKVGVQLYDTAGNPVDRSFHLIVAC